MTQRKNPKQRDKEIQRNVVRFALVLFLVAVVSAAAGFLQGERIALQKVERPQTAIVEALGIFDYDKDKAREDVQKYPDSIDAQEQASNEEDSTDETKGNEDALNCMTTEFAKHPKCNNLCTTTYVGDFYVSTRVWRGPVYEAIVDLIMCVEKERGTEADKEYETYEKLTCRVINPKEVLKNERAPESASMRDGPIVYSVPEACSELATKLVNIQAEEIKSSKDKSSFSSEKRVPQKYAGISNCVLNASSSSENEYKYDCFPKYASGKDRSDGLDRVTDERSIPAVEPASLVDASDDPDSRVNRLNRLWRSFTPPSDNESVSEQDEDAPNPQLRFGTNSLFNQEERSGSIGLADDPPLRFRDFSLFNREERSGNTRSADATNRTRSLNGANQQQSFFDGLLQSFGYGFLSGLGQQFKENEENKNRNADQQNQACPQGYEQRRENGRTVCAPAEELSCDMIANTRTIDEGESAVVRWRTAGATSVSIEGIGENLELRGEQEVTPRKTTTYTLTATGDAIHARTETCGLTITVREDDNSAPPQLSCTPELLRAGEEGVVSWSCPAPADESSGIGIDTQGARSGEARVAPDHNTEYGVMCLEDGEELGKDTCAVTVGEPLYNIIADPQTAKPGERVRVSWASLFMDSCRVVGPRDFSYDRTQAVVVTVPFAETVDSSVTSRATYVMECVDEFDERVVTKDVTVQLEE